MTAASGTAWRREFGITAQRSSRFIANTHDLDFQGVAQAHVLRRAFHLFGLDGVLCDETAPLVYFKLMDPIDSARVLQLHKQLWNHSGAPILAIISSREVQVHSGLTRPTGEADLTGLPSLVTNIERASSALREFLPAVESGEFFCRHEKSFDANERVDRALLDNLQETRDELAKVGSRQTPQHILDALLCRLVFTCYLFDREVIGADYLESLGLPQSRHLRDVLGIKPQRNAKAALYRLFKQLSRDFNGDLFSDNLDQEADLLSPAHLDVVESFFQATDVKSGQRAFWPYDFGIIPIEAISAIYERFLKPTDRETGAFYTPRFLAELVLDLALSKRPSLLGLRYLDPACGSGIFLVGLFNRMAEEWRRAHPRARNDRRARELKEILLSSISGVDVNPTACRIAAFSLYLAYLDQLEPRDIQELQQKGSALPRLVRSVDHTDDTPKVGGIWCGDFFDEDAHYPSGVNVVVGNPPWGSIAGGGSAAADWCKRHERQIPDKQIAAAFAWKAAEHVSESGRVCLVLPHGILFNHSDPALAFQRLFIQRHAIDHVLNLTDYQSFLFSKARHPAIVLTFGNRPPSKRHTTEYWVPKTDWKVTKAQVVAISEQDRSTLAIQSILQDLEGEDAPQIWKRMSWATPRDRRLLDRLAALPRLRDRVRPAGKPDPGRPWIVAEGLQPFGKNDPRSSKKRLQLPCRRFVPATSSDIQLFLLPEDCQTLPSDTIDTRRLIRDTRIFRAPHVLVAKGFGSIAFADFDVSFRHAVRGISGPTADHRLLMFLAAYMRSALAQYFLFHTSSNWGVSRQEVHVEELLRLPFPMPDALADADRAKQIVGEVSRLIQSASAKVARGQRDRVALVNDTQAQIEPLIYEYFDVLPAERILVEDTVQTTIPSFRPSTTRWPVPAIEPSTPAHRARYANRLCATLNNWARGGPSRVAGSVTDSAEIGLGLVVLQKMRRGDAAPPAHEHRDLLAALDRLRSAASLRVNTFELARGVKVFDGNRLFIVKPLARRYWTETAALNDADEIAGSILMQAPGESK